MKLQSAIEFISTYGFMFLTLTLVIALILFLATYNGTAATTTCTTFSTFLCNYVNFYPNVTYGYGIVSFVFSNGQNAPINITSISLKIDNYTGAGACSPAFVYPAQETTCLVAYHLPYLTTTLHNGQYYVKAGFCNSGITFLNSSSCGYSNVTYTGTFQVYNNPNDTTPLSVIAASTTNLPAQTLTIPQPPSNALVLQNGDLVTARNLTGVGYAFGTSSFLKSSYFGMNVLTYPTALSVLTTNTISCAAPSNSILSISYGVFYLPTTRTVRFSAYADNALEIFYKLNTSSVWNTAFAGAGWTTGTPSTQTSTNSLVTGTYQFAVAWVNNCGDGVQAISVNAIGQ